eukprot:gene33306-42662_t
MHAAVDSQPAVRLVQALVGAPIDDIDITLLPTGSHGGCAPQRRALARWDAAQWQPHQLQEGAPLNCEQLQAVATMVRTVPVAVPQVVLVPGPPGTGKTRTLVEAILHILQIHPRARVLATASSNHAADLIVSRVHQGWGGLERRAGPAGSSKTLVASATMFRLNSVHRNPKQVELNDVQQYTMRGSKGNFE